MENRKNKYFTCSMENDIYGGIWQCICDTEKTLKLELLEEVYHSCIDKDAFLVLKKDNNCKHTLQEYDNDFVVYPHMAGIPYFFEPLEKFHLENEIRDCKQWHVDDSFYRDLLKETN